MKFYRTLLPYLILFFMATSAFAADPKKMENAAVHTSESGFALVPWNLFIGGANSFVVGAEWIFGNYNILYTSVGEANELPRHSWVWALRTQALWAPKFGVFLQPTMQYTFIGNPPLALFKFSIGPEIGYKRDVGFEYGGSVRIGTLIDLVNFEVGYLVRSERLYMNIILNLPTGLGIWV